MSWESHLAKRPPTKSTPITPHDTNACPDMRRLFVSGGGVVVGRLVEDEADRSFTCVSGQVLEGRFILVKSTGTTATGLIALA